MKNLLYLTVTILLGSCVTVPPINIYDRPTIMEAETAARWPEFEKELREELILEGSSPLQETQSYETDDIFNLLNGFYINQAKNK